MATYTLSKDFVHGHVLLPHCHPVISVNVLGHIYAGIKGGITYEKYYAPYWLLPERMPALLHDICHYIHSRLHPDHIATMAQDIIADLIYTAYETSKISTVMEISRHTPLLDFFNDCRNEKRIEENHLIRKLDGPPEHTEQSYDQVKNELLCAYPRAADDILKECRSMANKMAATIVKEECIKLFGDIEGLQQFNDIFPPAWNMGTFGLAAAIMSKQLRKQKMADFDKVFAQHLLQKNNTPHTDHLIAFLEKSLSHAQDYHRIAGHLSHLHHDFMVQGALHKGSQTQASLIHILEEHIPASQLEKLETTGITLIITNQKTKECMLVKPWLIHNQEKKNPALYFLHNNSFITTDTYFIHHTQEITSTILKQRQGLPPVPPPSETKAMHYAIATHRALAALNLSSLPHTTTHSVPVEASTPPVKTRSSLTLENDMLHALAAIPAYLKDKQGAHLKTPSAFYRKLEILYASLCAKTQHNGAIETALTYLLSTYLSDLKNCNTNLPYALSEIHCNLHTPHYLSDIKHQLLGFSG